MNMLPARTPTCSAVTQHPHKRYWTPNVQHMKAQPESISAERKRMQFHVHCESSKWRNKCEAQEGGCRASGKREGGSGTDAQNQMAINWLRTPDRARGQKRNGTCAVVHIAHVHNHNINYLNGRFFLSPSRVSMRVLLQLTCCEVAYCGTSTYTRNKCHEALPNCRWTGWNVCASDVKSSRMTNRWQFNCGIFRIMFHEVGTAHTRHFFTPTWQLHKAISSFSRSMRQPLRQHTERQRMRWPTEIDVDGNCTVSEFNLPPMRPDQHSPTNVESALNLTQFRRYEV